MNPGDHPEAAAAGRSPDPPRSAYVHVPFCAHRCGYCNFTVVAARDDLADAYLRAVARELSWLGDQRPVDTLYIGGGTPTRLPLPLLEALCDLTRRWFPLAPGGEWTVEANPADLRPGVLDLLAERGVTRVSLGGQSFDPRKLHTLERDHAADDVARALDACRERGLEAALDLIFAAPGETLDAWRGDLNAALALRPGHLSTYGLTFEKGTAFWSRRMRGELAEADELLQREMYLTAIQTLTGAGYEHYEVSNFARPGRRSRHNEAYWAGHGYYAVGPGASRHASGIRETNHQSVTTYLRRVLRGESPVAFRETLTPEQRARERLVFGLRRLEGVERRGFAADTGFEIDALAGPAIERFCSLGLLSADACRVRLTTDGLLISDALWPELL